MAGIVSPRDSVNRRARTGREATNLLKTRRESTGVQSSATHHEPTRWRGVNLELVPNADEPDASQDYAGASIGGKEELACQSL